MDDIYENPGHNQPPPLTLAEALAPEQIDIALVTETAPLKEREQALVDMCRRFLAQYPAIETDEADGKAAEVMAVCQRFTSASGRIETARVAFKAPVLAATKQIDAAFGAIGADLTVRPLKTRRGDPTLVEQISALSIAFKQRKEDAIREAARKEAARKAEEAALAEKLAAKNTGIVTMEDAATAAAEADRLAAIAAAPAADLTRTRGDVAGTTSLRYVRVVTIIDPLAVPVQFCRPDIRLIEAYVGKAGTPLPTVAGCKIEDVPDLTRR